MARTQRRKKTSDKLKERTPRRPYKGDDMVDTTTKAHVPKNKPNRKTDKQKHIKEEFDNYE